MPLAIRPTGLASPVDKDRQDYTIFSGKWARQQLRGSRWAASVPWF
jgi:hypothetical protein